MVIDRHLGNVGILAKFASEVAPHGGNRIGKGARQKMKQRFFFDGVHMPRNDFSINQGVQRTVLILANAAFTAVARFYHAAMAA
jgi:hypothetical protein